MAGAPLGCLRVSIGLLAVTAVVTRLIQGIADPPFHLVRFFSFFTIESNLIAAAVLIVAGTATLRGRPRSARLDSWRGAATLYMVTTGVVYSVLLAGDGSSQAWVNFVLHYLMPVALIADWALDLPPEPIPFRRAIAWIGFPAAFAAYSLIRGAIIDWYAYPFLDPTQHGYPGAVAAVLVIGAGMLGVIWLLARSSAWAAARPAPTAVP